MTAVKVVLVLVAVACAFVAYVVWTADVCSGFVCPEEDMTIVEGRDGCGCARLARFQPDAGER